MPKQGVEGNGGGVPGTLARKKGLGGGEGGRLLSHHTWACGKWESQVELLIVLESGVCRTNDFDGRR